MGQPDCGLHAAAHAPPAVSRSLAFEHAWWCRGPGLPRGPLGTAGAACLVQGHSACRGKEDSCNRAIAGAA